ncbi:MAG: hypothetical protein LBF34_04220 [Puniceicoccales bacterium]|jgi:acetyl esterase/lipase|nr:hypothetical protein [Puniceicoccales bacterium]
MNKLKIYVMSLLSLNIIRVSTPRLHGTPSPEDSSSIQHRIEGAYEQFADKFKKIQELKNAPIPDITQRTKEYALTIAEEIEPYKYCKDIDQAAQLSYRLEYFQTTVDRFCDLSISAITSARAELRQFIKELESISEEIDKLPDENPNKEEYSDKIFALLTRCYDLNFEITRKLESVKQTVTPLLFEPFLLESNNPIVKFEMLTMETGNLQLPMVVYSPARKTPEEKFSCVFWLHGGDIYSDLAESSTLHIESPEQIALPFDLDRFWSNASVGLQSLARLLASQGIVLATIEFDAKLGKGNLRQQVKDQVEKVKELSYIDTDKMSFLGHSIGGYILSLLVVNDYQFLIENFKFGVAFVSPVFNEAWSGGIYGDQSDQSAQDRNQNCFLNFALPNGKSFYPVLSEGESTNDYSIKEILYRLPNLQDKKRVFQYVYPFSPTCGMSNDELRPKLASLPRIFILAGTADSNTLPATQGGTLAWRLKKMKLENWRILTYKNALHSPHRLGIYFGNPPSQEGFQQMLSDVLSIAKGTPPTGTQNLDELSNGTTQVYDFFQQQNTTRYFAEYSYFMEFNARWPEFVPFGATECGREILKAMRAKDESHQ